MASDQPALVHSLNKLHWIELKHISISRVQTVQKPILFGTSIVIYFLQTTAYVLNEQRRLHDINAIDTLSHVS